MLRLIEKDHQAKPITSPKKDNHMIPRLKTHQRFQVSLCAVLISLTTGVQAQTATMEKPMELKPIMESLNLDMQAITSAISKGDWAQVAKHAQQIVDHKQPSFEEKTTVITWLGNDAGQFRGYDAQVQEAATGMLEAAEQGNANEVITMYAKTLENCVACHKSFRKPFVQQFYKTAP